MAVKEKELPPPPPLQLLGKPPEQSISGRDFHFSIFADDRRKEKGMANKTREYHKKKMTERDASKEPTPYTFDKTKMRCWAMLVDIAG